MIIECLIMSQLRRQSFDQNNFFLIQQGWTYDQGNQSSNGFSNRQKNWW